ncbi:cytochrome P450 [Nocardia yamanashiensis]|uniref:cytochrome P450 n=1 Tax=Nocardia yamanashiensis TaxID=209247 RepID=UPI001E5312CB|nr:cytochrome P450 [Nocardia yamanashiensis]UGT45349.1 cytochrome P450 [Nocardia yamanashiensis]
MALPLLAPGPRATIPTAPGALPLLGHSLALLRDPLALLRSLPEHGEVVRLRLGGNSCYVACTPESTHELLHEPRAFDKGGFFYSRLRELTGDNVGTCPHAVHAAQRRQVQPIFHKHRMPGYARTMVEQTAAVTDGWSDGMEIDAFRDMLRIGARCAAALVFGVTLAPAVLDRTITDITHYVEGIFVRMFLPPALTRLPMPVNRHYDQVRNRLRDMVGELIDGYVRDGRCAGGDLMAALLEADPEAREARSEHRAGVVDQLTLMLMAGTESSATTVSWALHELSADQRLQRRVQDELDAVLGSELPAHHHVDRLPLLGRVLTETLRKYPAAWILSRVATADTMLGGELVPAGSSVAYSPYLIHHRPDLFPDPERFEPDRWLPGHSVPRKALIPFGGGTRKCAGDTFAVIEATLVLARILTRFSVHPVPSSPVRLVAAGALQPGGLRLRLTARA